MTSTNQINKTIANIVGGELTPLMYGRNDLATYQKSVAKAENFILMPQGGGRYRNGTSFVHNTKLNRIARFIPFQFSDIQSYLIEASDLCFRFYKDTGLILGNDIIITAMTNANPGVFTTQDPHGLAVGQNIILNNMNNTVGLNGNTYAVNTVPSTTTFTINSGGTPVDTTGSGTFSPNGKANRIYTITGVTSANPATVTLPAHGFSTGDEVFISGVNGPTTVNNKFFLINVIDADHFSLTDIFGNAKSTAGEAAFSASPNATASRVYEVVTPYAQADIFDLQFTQNADTMYITDQNYEPRKLIRNGHANWKLATFTRTNDPFADEDWPRSCAFVDSGRLFYGGSRNHPESIWGSRAPTSGNTAFDDFTTSTGPTALATDALIFTLAPLQGRTDAIQWITSTNAFTVIGTFSTVRTLYGSSSDQPATPLAVTAKQVGNYGCSSALPVSTGFSLFHIQRASRVLRSVEYDITISGYTTTDRTLVSEHLTVNGLQQVVQQQGTPDLIWAVVGDGRVNALTFKEKEDISGWSRHFLGGKYVNSNGVTLQRARILHAGTLTRPTNTDQIWFIVERVINGRTTRSVEYMTDQPIYPVRSDFNGKGASKQIDDQKFTNSLYETQKYACHLDMSVLYDGTTVGAAVGAAITPSALLGVHTITASAPVFDSTMVGREIRDQFDLNGDGGGRATITAVVDSTHATVKSTVPWTSLSQILAGQWLMTTNHLSGLDYLEGETISVLADGGPDNDVVVTNGAITISAQASVVCAGYKYRGTLEYLNLDPGAQSGPAQAKNRNLVKVAIRFYNTLGAAFGTDFYNLERMVFRSTADDMDRPTPPFSGTKEQFYPDRWEDDGKILVIVQNNPLPCTVLNTDLYFNTEDD